MTISCQTISVKRPAHITATAMTIDHTDCDTPCTTRVTVTWTNTGTRNATTPTTPSIIVDGTSYPGTSITLAAGASSEQTFDLIGLLEGEHSVCPDPN